MKRFKEIRKALSIKNDLKAHHKWTRREIEALQQEQLSLLVIHAVRESPFYKERCGDMVKGNRVVLQELPIINKEIMMENFDRMVTDPRLKLAELQAYLEQLTRDDHYLGEYRVFTTSGSTGLKGTYVFSRDEWSIVLGSMFRLVPFMGISERLNKRSRLCWIGAHNPKHISYCLAVGSDTELSRTRRLEATNSIDDLIISLNKFQPDAVHAYPSIISLLALEQVNGRLNIHPHIISTFGELRTEEMTRNIRQAWAPLLFNNYGITEVGIFGSDCPLQRGIHILDDLFIVEVVDERNRAVSNGSTGHKLLITNLFNYTQPLIRFEVSDMIALAKEPCPCGRPFNLIHHVEGRSDDIIYLQDLHDKDKVVPLHPIHFRSTISAFGEIKEYHVLHNENGIFLDISVQEDAPREKIKRKLEGTLKGILESHGARCPPIDVRFVHRIVRDPRKMGKLKLVDSTIKRPTSFLSGKQ
jgi:phenylacetate-CoA ligase